jgi:hypothetical protein
MCALSLAPRLDVVSELWGMFAEFWTWLAKLPPSNASFVGTLAGSGLGLFALLLGALFNARLNRKRDDRLREEEARAVRSALKGELSGIEESLLKNAEGLDKAEDDFVVPDIAHSVRVMPAIIPKLGLLDAETTRVVIGIYVSIDQYCETLIMMGGAMATQNRADRRLIGMTVNRATNLARVNRDLAAMIRTAIERLNR